MFAYLAELKHEAEQAVWCDDFMFSEPGPQPTVTGYVLLITWWRLQHWVQWQICQRYGHHMVIDYSHAGPHSGSESGHCERCGMGWSHTYY